MGVQRNISPIVFPKTFLPRGFQRHDTVQGLTDHASRKDMLLFEKTSLPRL
jgi:hypothetical protein